MRTVSVVIPAMPHRIANGLVAEAINSVVAQDVPDVRTEIILAVEQPTEPLSHVDKIVDGPTQFSKSNAGAAAATSDYLAFLHDDDLWDPAFLKYALGALDDAGFEFVSTSSLELDADGNVMGIRDCAMPSGWVMRREVFGRVGPFDETYKWHADTEWLGRLEQGASKRAHLVEKHAPVKMLKGSGYPRFNQMNSRPELHMLLQHGRPEPALIYTSHALPLLIRRQFTDALALRFEDEALASAESHWENGRLVNLYNRIPW